VRQKTPRNRTQSCAPHGSMSRRTLGSMAKGSANVQQFQPNLHFDLKGSGFAPRGAVSAQAARGWECGHKEWIKILLLRSAKVCTFLRLINDKMFIYLILQWHPSCISVHVRTLLIPPAPTAIQGFGFDPGNFAGLVCRRAKMVTGQDFGRFRELREKSGL
jgi:hypothetical protein